MSDTPRTEEVELPRYYSNSESPKVVYADFARQLERELNEANAQLRSLKLELKESYNLKNSLVKEHLELCETLKEANADRLRLRVALRVAESMLCKQGSALRQLGAYEPCAESAILDSRFALTTPRPPVVDKADADALALLLGSIMRDLPTNKDWLDPALEKAAEEALGAYRNKYKEGNQ